MPQPPSPQQYPNPAHAQAQLVLPFQSLPQFLQSQVRLTPHLSLDPLPDRRCDLALRPVPPRTNLDMTGLDPARRELLGPILTDTKPLRQLLQAAFPAVIRLEELPPQIVRVCFWHLVERTIATLSLQHKSPRA